MERPDWWEWDLVFTFHVESRMEERGFSEVEIRQMVEEATAIDGAQSEGRWVLRTRCAGGPWRVVLEPDYDEQVIVVVTAYPVESST